METKIANVILEARRPTKIEQTIHTRSLGFGEFLVSNTQPAIGFGLGRVVCRIAGRALAREVCDVWFLSPLDLSLRSGGSGTSGTWNAGGGGGAGSKGMSGTASECGNGGKGYESKITGKRPELQEC